MIVRAIICSVPRPAAAGSHRRARRRAESSRHFISPSCRCRPCGISDSERATSWPGRRVAREVQRTALCCLHRTQGRGRTAGRGASSSSSSSIQRRQCGHLRASMLTGRSQWGQGSVLGMGASVSFSGGTLQMDAKGVAVSTGFATPFTSCSRRGVPRILPRSGLGLQQLLHHLARHVGQAEIAALEAVGQLQVVEAEQVQDRGVEVVDVDRVLDDVPADVVGLADRPGRP